MSLYRVRVRNGHGRALSYLGNGRLKRAKNATLYSAPSAARRAMLSYAKKNSRVVMQVQKRIQKNGRSQWISMLKPQFRYNPFSPPPPAHPNCRSVAETIQHNSRMHRPGQPAVPVHEHVMAASVLDSVVQSALKNKGLSPESKGIGVPEILEEMAKTFRERNAIYGDNWKMVGEVMGVLFPHGVRLSHKHFIDGAKSTPPIIHYDVWHLFELQVVKLTRFAISGLTHIDSIHDQSVYGAMIEGILKQLEKANAGKK